MTIWLVRHAIAGPRRAWQGRDELRPLEPRGHDQAQRLAEHLADAGVERVVSSPARRCVQTVAPLADATGLEVEVAGALAEGAPAARARALADPGSVLCTHGDVIPAVVRLLVAGGMVVDGDQGCAMASTWEIETDDDGSPVGASYHRLD